MHYNRIIRRGGSPELPQVSIEDRFWSKVDKTGDCWIWTAGKNNFGYGGFCINQKVYKAHRVSYEWANGSLPADGLVDHICRNTSCVNPSHLRLVTAKENVENVKGPAKHNKSSGVRGVSRHGKGRWQARTTHNGKSYTAGTFATIAEAEAAVIALRNRLFTHNDADRQQGP